MLRLLIIGAGGHGRSVAEAAVACGCFQLVGFLDDAFPALADIRGVPVLGTTAALGAHCALADAAIVAIGNSESRERLFSELGATGLVPVTVIHPAAVISPSAVIGAGCTIMAGAIIGAEAWLGYGVIVNSGSVIDHDCQVGDFCHLGVRAAMAGGAVLGRQAWMKAGAILGYGAVVEAGAVVACGEMI